MMKFIILAVMSVWLVACSAHDEQYYRAHPVALQDALTKCPDQQPAGLSCQQLKDIALRLNELAYQLRMNPQDFGKQILALQETIAKQENTLQQNPNQPEVKAALDKNMQQLKERIAVVKWLESPER